VKTEKNKRMLQRITNCAQQQHMTATLHYKTETTSLSVHADYCLIPVPIYCILLWHLVSLLFDYIWNDIYYGKL